jgi:hypothetical protein
MKTKCECCKKKNKDCTLYYTIFGHAWFCVECLKKAKKMNEQMIKSGIEYDYKKI